MSEPIEPISAAIRSSLLGNAAIVDFLGVWKGAASIHTRRPVPKDAPYPLILASSTNAGATNEDGLISRRPLLVRDVFVYGVQPTDLREVDAVAEMISAHFHRKRFALSIPGYHVLDIIADRPRPAPVDNDSQVGRLIQLQLRLKDLSG